MSLIPVINVIIRKLQNNIWNNKLNLYIKIRPLKKSLKRHNESIHKNVTYSCDLCIFKTTRKYSLKYHIESRHLEQHIKSIHKNVAYPCEKCDYRTTSQLHLKWHIQSKHENVTYPCDQCDYKATSKQHLNGTLKLYIEISPILVTNVSIRQFGSLC